MALAPAKLLLCLCALVSPAAGEDYVSRAAAAWLSFIMWQRLCESRVQSPPIMQPGHRLSGAAVSSVCRPAPLAGGIASVPPPPSSLGDYGDAAPTFTGRSSSITAGAALAPTAPQVFDRDLAELNVLDTRV